MPDDTLLADTRDGGAPTSADADVYPVSRNDVYQSVNRDLVAALDLPADAAVVDLGCGDGMLSRLLLERHGEGLRIWALDPDEAMLDGARRNLGDRVGVCPGAAETFAAMFPPASCDAVVLANSLHLVAERAALYAGVRRVLRPGGLFGLNTSFYENVHTASNGTLALSAYLEARGLAKRRGIVIPPAPPQLARTLPTAEALTAELVEAGLEVTRAGERPLVMDVPLLQSFVDSPYFAATVFPALDLAVGGALLAEAVESVAAKRSKPVERSWLTVVARQP
jgi:SAM-dependent methyltransferase